MERNTSLPELDAPAEYRYKQLPEGRYTRFLLLDPGQGDEPLSGVLITEALSSGVPYEAISYVWGSNVKDHTILCSGRIIHITANLHSVLRQVRWPTKFRAVWADSICINQDDIDERTQQVASMGDIYSEASRVLMCLGADERGQAKGAASLTGEIASMVRQTIEELGLEGGLRGNFPAIDPDDPIFTDGRWTCLEALTAQPWFTRVWVVQEVGLAREVLVVWGGRELSWDSVMITAIWHAVRGPQSSTSRWYGRINGVHLESLQQHHRSLYRTLNRNPVRQDFSELFPSTFPQLLDMTRTLQLADPRDRIYAFSGLAKRFTYGAIRIEIQPDYKRDFRVIYREFARQHIMTTGELDMLHAVTKSCTTMPGSLESWVPRWDLDSEQPDATRWMMEARITPRNGDSWKPEFVGNNGLKVRGVVLDRICFTTTHVFENRSLDDGPDDDLAALEILVHGWNQALSHRAMRPGLVYPPGNQLLALSVVLTWAGHWLGWDTWCCARAAFILKLIELGAAHDCSPADLQRYRQEAAGGQWQDFWARAWSRMAGCKLMTTERGYLGFVPEHSQVDDFVCIIFGTRAPFVLRRVEIDEGYKLLGQCFVAGKKVYEKTYELGPDFSFPIVAKLGGPLGRDWEEWNSEEQDIVIC